MEVKNLVHNWLLGGADPEVGLRLFMDYVHANSAVSRLISKNPDRHLQTIRISLLKAAGLPLTFSVEQKKIASQPQKEDYRLRNQWPFLADPECPPELKLLISDKITAYTICVSEYDNLTAGTHEDQLRSVSRLVDNFINNHRIFKELEHYNKNKSVLGEHEVFSQYKKLKALRGMTTMDLFKKKKNLENNIWRTESKIKNEKRQDLLSGRESKLKEFKMLLAEVNRLLE